MLNILLTYETTYFTISIAIILLLIYGNLSLELNIILGIFSGLIFLIGWGVRLSKEIGSKPIPKIY
tara:strand:+ start:3951 stop:4148 length:198 start_codon:yes stop_codon:yes gene_type:complete